MGFLKIGSLSEENATFHFYHLTKWNNFATLGFYTDISGNSLRLMQGIPWFLFAEKYQIMI